jgi:hypothetical protein
MSIAQHERICVGPNCGRRLVPQSIPPRERPPGTHATSARGLCHRCYTYAEDTGTLELYPRLTRRQADVLDDWTQLRRRGYTKREAAKFVGMTFAAFDRAVCRARAVNRD